MSDVQIPLKFARFNEPIQLQGAATGCKTDSKRLVMLEVHWAMPFVCIYPRNGGNSKPPHMVPLFNVKELLPMDERQALEMGVHPDRKTKPRKPAAKASSG